MLTMSSLILISVGIIISMVQPGMSLSITGLVAACISNFAMGLISLKRSQLNNLSVNDHKNGRLAASSFAELWLSFVYKMDK